MTLKYVILSREINIKYHKIASYYKLFQELVRNDDKRWRYCANKRQNNAGNINLYKIESITSGQVDLLRTK